MKKWIAEFLALAISASSITPLYGEEANLPNSGKETVLQVEAAYQKGEYDAFLEELHTQYQRAGEAGALRGVFGSAKAALKEAPSLEKYQTEISELDRERNKRLLDAIEANPNAAIAKKVDSIIFFSLPDELSSVLKELEALKFHIPENSTGTIKNKVSALETEYYIKSLLLDIAAHRAGSDTEELAKKKIALALEKLDKMEDAAKEADDVVWAKKIQTAKTAYRADKAYKIDLEVLQALAKGAINAKSPVEKNVQRIMMDYLEQKQANFDQRSVEIAKK